MQCDGILIDSNNVRSTYGSSISLMSTCNDVLISNNILLDYNQGNILNVVNGLSQSTYGGVELTRLSFYRSSNQQVSGNVCKSKYGYGVFAGFSEGVNVTGNKIDSFDGIIISSQNNCNVTDNYIKTSGSDTTRASVTIQDPSGGNQNSNIRFQNNFVFAGGGYGIQVTDANVPYAEKCNAGNFILGTVASDAGVFTAADLGNQFERSSMGKYNGNNYIERRATAWEVASEIQFTTLVPSNVIYQVAVGSEAFVGSTNSGLYLVSRSAGTPVVNEIVPCDADVTINASGVVKITNNTGGSRQLVGTLTLIG